MMMRDRFEEIFEEVMEELDLEAWYELFDSANYDTMVVARIVAEFGEEVLDSEEFQDWDYMMAMDL